MTPAYDEVTKTASIDCNIPAELVSFARGAGEHLRQSYGTVQIRQAALLAKTAFEAAGQKGSIPHQLFDALEQLPEENPQNRKLASIVFQGLGRAKNTVERQMSRLDKQADNPLRKALAVAGAALSGVGNTAKTVFGVGALAGSTVGGGAWLANRGLKKQDRELAKLEARRNTYLRLAAEVESELESRKLAPTPSNIAGTIDYLT